METSNDDSSAEKSLKKDIYKQIDDDMKRRNFDSRSGRAMGGVVIIGIGALLLARQMGVELPYWLFTWPMVLIGIGLFVGAKHEFRTAKFLIPIFVGSVFLVEEINPDLSFKQYIWPVVIIGVGLAMMFRPRRKNFDQWKDWRKSRYMADNEMANTSDEEFIDAVSVFGGSKRNVISKNFKGADMTAFFGGNDINLMQADFTGVVVMDITNVFGGTKLIVPPTWNIKSEVTSIFGSVEDKRPIIKDGIGSVDNTKALKLIGTNIFGGIEIKSY